MDSMSIPYPYKYKYNQYKANIIGDFLLSTDYFMNQMDNTKPLSYTILTKGLVPILSQTSTILE